MSVLSEKIDDFNSDGKEVKDSKESVKKAIEAYNKMKPALAKAEEKKRSAKPKVFKVDIKEEPKRESTQSSVNMFGTSTVVSDFNDIGIGVKTVSKKAKEDKEIDFANVKNGIGEVKLKFVDHSNLYKVEASNVLNLNPFQISFSESELNQFTYQNPMIAKPQEGFNKQSF
jgi:hypothetical protein